MSDKGNFESAGRKVDEHLRTAGAQLEQELQRMSTYINDQVIPEVRRHSMQGLRAAAVQLHRVAELLEKHTG